MSHTMCIFAWLHEMISWLATVLGRSSVGCLFDRQRSPHTENRIDDRAKDVERSSRADEDATCSANGVSGRDLQSVSDWLPWPR